MIVEAVRWPPVLRAGPQAWQLTPLHHGGADAARLVCTGWQVCVCVPNALTRCSVCTPLQLGGADEDRLVFTERSGKGIQWFNRCDCSAVGPWQWSLQAQSLLLYCSSPGVRACFAGRGRVGPALGMAGPD